MQSIFQIRHLHQQASDALHRREKEREYRTLENSQGWPGSNASEKHQERDVEASPSQIPNNSPVAPQDFCLPYSLPSVRVQQRTNNEENGSSVFVVGWEGSDDPMNPKNWSNARRIGATSIVALISFTVSAASSIDTAVTPQASAVYHVSEVAGSLMTACYLIGLGVGSLFAGSFSETLGRNAVYVGSTFMFMTWLLGAALAPNFGAKIVFRFLAGICASPVLTLQGGSLADLYNPLELTLGFPLMITTAFAGPVVGPVISAYMGRPGGISWRWSEWIMLILAGVLLTILVLFQPETYGPLILDWKAKQYRKLTGDVRFRSELDLVGSPLLARLVKGSARPFMLVWTEPIVLIFCLYMSIIYIILFTFFDGYNFIFGEIHSLSTGLTNLIWLANLVGIFCAFPIIALVYKWTRREFARAVKEERVHPPEIRIWFAMLGGSFAIPVSLFWMAWTSYPHISIWSPIVASAFFGYGIITVFITAYMYIIEVYRSYAASALSFNAFSRYMLAAGMTVVGVPFYRNVGVHFTLTILACISVTMTPVPFILYRYGPAIRSWSRNAQNKT